MNYSWDINNPTWNVAASVFLLLFIAYFGASASLRIKELPATSCSLWRVDIGLLFCVYIIITNKYVYEKTSLFNSYSMRDHCHTGYIWNWKPVILSKQHGDIYQLIITATSAWWIELNLHFIILGRTIDKRRKHIFVKIWTLVYSNSSGKVWWGL